MIVPTTLQYVDVEVSISLEDIVCAIAEDTDRVHTVQRGINNCHSFLKAVPQDVIAQMSPQAKKVIYEAMLKQIERYQASEGVEPT
jgi:hypothetical protein